MGGIENFKALVLLIIFLQFYNGFGLKMNENSERLDDTELKMLTARNENRKLHHSLDNMEGGSDISLAQEDSSRDEIQHIDRTLNDIKELLGTTKLAEIFERFDLLNIGLNEKKKKKIRLRRRVSQRDVLGSLSNNSDTLTRITFAFFEDLRETNEGLRETNKIMKEMYENTSNALVHVTDVLESMTKNMVNVVHVNSVLEMTIKEIMAKYSLDFQQEMRKIRCEVSQPRSCLELLKYGCTESGVYSVFLGINAIQVYCDQSTDGGGWTVFQRRQDGSVDFFRDWEDYKKGFGNLAGEFWLGNDKLHRLLSVKSGYELRVDLGDFDNNIAYAKYRQFMIGPENTNYVLTAEGYSGDAGDSLSYHSRQQFSTKDRDNDSRPWSPCSQEHKGGWWYSNCQLSNLNGLYNTDKQSSDPKNVAWYRWKIWFPLEFSEMKFRELM